jgi:hypothetical protein
MKTPFSRIVCDDCGKINPPVKLTNFTNFKHKSKFWCKFGIHRWLISPSSDSCVCCFDCNTQRSLDHSKRWFSRKLGYDRYNRITTCCAEYSGQYRGKTVRQWLYIKLPWKWI